MKNLKLSILFTFLVFFLNTSFTYEQLPENIKNAFKLGNSTELAKYFNSNVELGILENEAIYSKSQAELVVKDFFRRNKPSEFTVIQEEFNSTPKFAIGRLITVDKEQYRVYFSLRKTKGQLFISQLKIEEED